MLAELQLAYQFKYINLMKGEAHSAEYKAINPGCKVPSLSDDDLNLTESAAIVTYLGDKYGDGKLVPVSGTSDRARYDQWMAFAISELEQPLWTMGKHKFALPAERRVPEIMETAAWEFQKALTLLSKGLEGNAYILGEQFTGADILLGHTLFWGLGFKQPIEQENLQHYIERLKERPARKQAIEREQSISNSKR
jgi:glutathione S-transferase